jgi:hypothetical protein
VLMIKKRVRASIFAIIALSIVTCLGSAIGFASGSYEQASRTRELLKNSPDGVIRCGTGNSWPSRRDGYTRLSNRNACRLGCSNLGVREETWEATPEWFWCWRVKPVETGAIPKVAPNNALQRKPRSAVHKVCFNAVCSLAERKR